MSPGTAAAESQQHQPSTGETGDLTIGRGQVLTLSAAGIFLHPVKPRVLR